MNPNAPTVDQAMAQITTLDDLPAVAAQRDLWNTVYRLAARKLREEASVQAIADAYGIHRTTAHVLIRDAA
jgi:acetoacetate decarboxylase